MGTARFSRSDGSVKRRPLETVELSIRGVRWAAIALVTAWMASSIGRLDVTTALTALVAPLALLAANLLSVRTARSSSVSRLIWLQLFLGVVAVVAMTLAIRPGGGSPMWAVIAFPVLEGAMRFQFGGAVMCWIAVATPLFIDRIMRWQPGDGVQPMTDLANRAGIALVLGMVAGHLAQHLVEEMYIVADEHEEAERRARLLAVLTVASARLASSSSSVLSTTAIESVVELGYEAATLIVTWEGDPSPTIVEEYGSTGLIPEGVADTVAHRSPRDIVDLASGGSAVGAADDTADDTASTADGLDGSPAKILGVVGRNGGRSMLLIVSSPTRNRARDQAFEVLVAYLAAALATVVRERDVAATERRLRHEATHDHLTGLLNRAGLASLAQEAVGDPGAATRLIGFIDLDGFKAINDTLGHEVGDAVLHAVGLRLDRLFGEDHWLARLGGDEFVVVSPPNPGVTEDEFSASVERIFSDPVATAKGSVEARGSVGVARFDPALDPSQQWRRADAEMYAAKAARKAQRHDAQRAASGVVERGDRGGHVERDKSALLVPLDERV
ncbi:MAG: GGDEF domain-containing protein [Microthrixaceae bacterium]|nr:GGDEF domain-containing protein [Microthrixaceae bacterium]